MYVTITIRFTSPAGLVLRRGEFPLKRRSPEQVTLDWWNQIKNEVFTDQLVSVEVNNEDITDKVRQLLEIPLGE